MTYRVTAPYVLLKVKDHSGTAAINGFYKGAVLSADVLDEESLKRHLDRGKVEKVDSEHAAEAITESAPKEVTGEPARNAPKGAWVDYAVAQGATREEAEASTKDELIKAYGS